MSCGDCSSQHLSNKPFCKSNLDNDGSLLQRLFQLVVKFLPEGSALLSSSCCWLPTVLDFLFAGSVATAGIEKLRNAFLAISVLTLLGGIWREGFSRRMVWRIAICVGLSAWEQVNQWGKVNGKGHHSCH
ncbi:cyclin domain protein [Penicillium digitatum]|uniref:Cyclin domain protein n=1 Tax=Penicillium digitatum TaxID=36651 RepID=A0A7T6XL24_PENDI|nr:cyclin domain protein [Penicillium digitatum]